MKANEKKAFNNEGGIPKIENEILEQGRGALIASQKSSVEVILGTKHGSDSNPN